MISHPPRLHYPQGDILGVSLYLSGQHHRDMEKILALHYRGHFLAHFSPALQFLEGGGLELQVGKSSVPTCCDANCTFLCFATQSLVP